VRGAVLGGSMYFFFAFVPVFLAYGAIMIDPATFGAMVTEDSQMVLPNLVLNHTPVFAQIVFFGALISAIMSTSSATLLAPAVSFSENIVKNIYPKMDDKALLLTMRISVFVFTIVVVAFAVNSESSIFEMVESAYEITLAAAFVPLVFGLYWKKATSQGAVCSIIVGVSSWLIAKNFFPSEIWPPQLLGMVLGLFTMIITSLLPQWIPHRPALRDGVVHPH